MGFDFVLGAVLLGAGIVLLVIGLPRGGEPPRFLQFSAAPVTYPAIILALLSLGAAEVISGFMAAR